MQDTKTKHQQQTTGKIYEFHCILINLEKHRSVATTEVIFFLQLYAFGQIKNKNKKSMLSVACVHNILSTKFARSFLKDVCIQKSLSRKVQKNLLQNDLLQNDFLT